MKRSVLAVASAAVLSLGVFSGVASAQEPSVNAKVCAALTARGLDLIKSTNEVQSLSALIDGQLTIDNVERARRNLNCGPVPDQTDDQLQASVCAALDINLYRSLLPADLSIDQQAVVAAATRLLPGSIDRTRIELGCSPSDGGVPQTPDIPVVVPLPDAPVSETPTPTIPAPTPDVVVDNGDDIATTVPQGGIETGAF